MKNNYSREGNFFKSFPPEPSLQNPSHRPHRLSAERRGETVRGVHEGTNPKNLADCVPVIRKLQDL